MHANDGPFGRSNGNYHRLELEALQQPQPRSQYARESEAIASETRSQLEIELELLRAAIRREREGAVGRLQASSFQPYEYDVCFASLP